MSNSSSSSSSASSAVEWDHNKSSSTCVLCLKPWGTFKRRRHHCRKCGRLVCDSCSAHRVQLSLLGLSAENVSSVNNNHNSRSSKGKNSKLNDDTTGNSALMNDTPQRVCDACFATLEKKKEMKIQIVHSKDKNMELMLSTSVVSESLITLFYLDGSRKTVAIDSCTTVADLSAVAVADVSTLLASIALFEVVQNVQDPSQYKLLNPSQTVMELVRQWTQFGQPYIKIVVPLHFPPPAAELLDLVAGTTRMQLLPAHSILKTVHSNGSSAAATTAKPIYLTTNTTNDLLTSTPNTTVTGSGSMPTTPVRNSSRVVTGSTPQSTTYRPNNNTKDSNNNNSINPDVQGSFSLTPTSSRAPSITEGSVASSSLLSTAVNTVNNNNNNNNNDSSVVCNGDDVPPPPPPLLSVRGQPDVSAAEAQQQANSAVVVQYQQKLALLERDNAALTMQVNNLERKIDTLHAVFGHKTAPQRHKKVDNDIDENTTSGTNDNGHSSTSPSATQSAAGASTGTGAGSSAKGTRRSSFSWAVREVIKGNRGEKQTEKEDQAKNTALAEDGLQTELNTSNGSAFLPPGGSARLQSTPKPSTPDPTTGAVGDPYLRHELQPRSYHAVPSTNFGSVNNNSNNNSSATGRSVNDMESVSLNSRQIPVMLQESRPRVRTQSSSPSFLNATSSPPTVPVPSSSLIQPISISAINRANNWNGASIQVSQSESVSRSQSQHSQSNLSSVDENAASELASINSGSKLNTSGRAGTVSIDAAYSGMSMTERIIAEQQGLSLLQQITQNPACIQSLSPSELHFFVRTYYCRVADIESFCNRYCVLFEEVVHKQLLSPQSLSAGGQSNQLHRGNTNEFKASISDVAGAGFTASKDMGYELIIHFYHMIRAMDGVYAFLAQYHEDYRAGLQQWLLRTFEECVALPVTHTDELQAAVKCLQQEDDLLYSPRVVEILQRSIDSALYMGIEQHQNFQQQSQEQLSGSSYEYEAYTSEIGEREIIGRKRGSLLGNMGLNTKNGESASSTYNYQVMSKFMDNAISTYYSVVGDLLTALPVEIDVFALFQLKLSYVLKHHIWGAFVAYKQFMGARELLKLVYFYDKLTVFCDKFKSTTSVNLIQNITEAKPEVFQQCNHALTASLSACMLSVFNNDVSAMANSTSGSGSGSNNANNANNSYGAMTSAPSSNEEIMNTSGISASAAMRTSIKNHWEVSGWPSDLVLVLQQHLGWIPADVDMKKCIYWCILLLDNLNEFHVKQCNWLQQGLSTQTINFPALVRYANNHTAFAVLLSTSIDEWYTDRTHISTSTGDRSRNHNTNDFTFLSGSNNANALMTESEKQAAAVYNKLHDVSGLFEEAASTAIENIATSIHDQIKSVFKEFLFVSGWDDSVQCLMQLKNMFHAKFQHLLHHLAGVRTEHTTGSHSNNNNNNNNNNNSGSSSMPVGTSLVQPKPANNTNYTNNSNNTNHPSVTGAGDSCVHYSITENITGVEAVQQLILYLCECTVAYYIELLLTKPSVSMNLTTISRLSEDLELLTKLFEELRSKYYIPTVMALKHIQNRHTATSQGADAERLNDYSDNGNVNKPPAKHPPPPLSTAAATAAVASGGLSSPPRHRSSKERGGGHGGGEGGTGNVFLTPNSKLRKAHTGKSFGKDFHHQHQHQQQSHALSPLGRQMSVESTRSDVPVPVPVPPSPLPSTAATLAVATSTGEAVDNSGLAVVSNMVTTLEDEEDSKAIFKQILQPLMHVVLAVQMNNQYLPDFVKNELYGDFGTMSTNIWQLIMYWRNESKEDIVEAHTKLYQDWLLEIGGGDGSVEDALVDVSYILNIKAANIVKR